MATKKYLDLSGLAQYDTKIKSVIPTKTSDLTNDSGFITDSKVVVIEYGENIKYSTVLNYLHNGYSVFCKCYIDVDTQVANDFQYIPAIWESNDYNIITFSCMTSNDDGETVFRSIDLEYQEENGVETYGYWNNFDEHFQNRLISGSNIKTINNQSLLGNGNISISGGSSLYMCEGNNTNSRRYQKLCHISLAKHIQGEFVSFKIYVGNGNNGRTDQNAYIDLILQKGYIADENNGHFGGNWIFHPINTSLTINNFDIVVTSDSTTEYNLWLWTDINYCRPNYYYECSSNINITHYGNVYQSEYPTSTETNCSILGVNDWSVKKSTSDFVTTDEILCTDKSLNANSQINATNVSITKSGYKPLGIMGYSMTGTNHQSTNIVILDLTASNNGSGTIQYRFRNLSASTTATITLTAKVLWLKV